ncbi:MAG TPA: SCO family protein [Terriglobia bacterium]|nr:SCO family protein [Terriglobia bacterium]
MNSKSKNKFLLALFFIVFCSTTPAQYRIPPIGQTPRGIPENLRNVGIDQKLNEQVPPGLVFRDETGRVVHLGEYFRNKPIILNLVYFECPMLCTQVLNGLVSCLRTLNFTIGNEFEVITVSFNPHEGPPLAAAKKEAYLDRYSRPGSEGGWHFLTGGEEAIQALTKAVGFRYSYDSRTGQYAHASGIMLLTPQGRVSRYFYGIEYAPRDLRLGLVEASANKIGTVTDQLLLFCYHYDPREGKYSTVILNLIRLGGVLTLLALGVAWFAWIRRTTWRHQLNGGRVQ